MNEHITVPIDRGSPMLENVSFTGGFPCRLMKKHRNIDDVSALHYASTIEILIVDNAEGLVCIGAQQYNTKKRDIFFIPPNTVHYTVFRAGAGDIYVFKISLELLSEYMNAEKLFAARGHTLDDVPYCLSQYYNEISEIIFKRISYEKDGILLAIEGIARLFCLLDNSISHSIGARNTKAEQRILDIMKWTTEHITEKITVEQAAAEAHYSKYYFCRFFKENTGITYLRYLQTLKINHAIELMREGHSTTYCCYECGFDNLSYFIKLFKDITGSTTVEYRKKLKAEKNKNGFGT